MYIKITVLPTFATPLGRRLLSITMVSLDTQTFLELLIIGGSGEDDKASCHVPKYPLCARHFTHTVISFNHHKISAILIFQMRK